jgi:hypothetical protein
MEKRTGRPPSQDPKTERLFIRVTPAEKAEIQEHSKKTGFSLLELLRKGMEVTKK